MNNLVFKQEENAPGLETEIGGIKTAVTEVHQEVLYYWLKYNLENATLLHIDAHPDLVDHVKLYKKEVLTQHRHYLNDQYICPSFFHKILSSMYWYNPHEKELKRVSTTKDKSGNKIIRVKTESNPFWVTAYWEGELKYLEDNVDFYNIKTENQLILNIDLDAFCCNKNAYQRGVIPNFDTINGYEERIKRTAEILKTLKNPEVITISRSSSKDKYVYVPDAKVDDVQACLLDNLISIYSK
jgi:hypothetical protein